MTRTTRSTSWNPCGIEREGYLDSAVCRSLDVEEEACEDIVSSAAFSPDGSRIVSGSADQTARI
jgi:hypothetical protein